MDFAKNLKKYRKARGLTQEQLTKILHYKYNTIGHFESGRMEPTPAVLIELAKFFGITTDALLGMEQDRKEMELREMLYLLNAEQKQMLLDKMAAFPEESLE